MSVGVCVCVLMYVLHLNVPLDYSARKSKVFREGFLHKQPKMYLTKYKQGSKEQKTLYLYLLEHVRMVTDLPQLHDGVHQSLGASFTLKHRKHPVSDM